MKHFSNWKVTDGEELKVIKDEMGLSRTEVFLKSYSKKLITQNNYKMSLSTMLTV